MEISLPNKNNFNLAGIVPVDSQPLDFEFPWHDSLMPIGKNYLAAEKAVFDCAVAGCDTIWIVCSKDMQPLIRYRIGDYVVDPIIYHKQYKFSGTPLKKEIPIYYVPTHPKDADRRKSIPWSIITGAQAAWRVGRKLSRYTTPDQYFVAFPYGMFSSYHLSDYRTQIRKQNCFYATCAGQSFLTGDYLPFSFSPQDFLTCRKNFRSSEIKPVKKDGKTKNNREKIFNGRYFTHDFVFSNVDLSQANVAELPWYYNVSSWGGLKTWLASENKLDKPPDFALSYNEWNPLGIEDEEDEQR